MFAHVNKHKETQKEEKKVSKLETSGPIEWHSDNLPSFVFCPLCLRPGGEIHKQ